MKSYEKFNCFLMGETSLLIQCSELLLQKKHQILGIITSSQEIAAFAEKHKIIHVSDNSDYLSFLKATPFDYFFSIVNHHVLHHDALQLPKKLAINYHDSLLPRYAGINATSWALMNQEAMHGISWHVISNKVDTGDILKQPRFEIGTHNTSFRLNLKCYQAALQAFDELIDELATGRAVGKTQNLQHRSYFGKYKKPPSGCVISCNRSPVEIEAFTRALDFGAYANPLGVPKLKIADDFIIVKEVDTLDYKSGYRPGMVVDIDTNGLTVAASGGDVRIKKIMNVDGDTLVISDLVHLYQLQPGSMLESLPPETDARLTALYNQVSKTEQFWTDRLSRLEFFQFPLTLGNERPSGNSKYFSISVQYHRAKTASKDIIEKTGYMAFFVSVLAAYFNRISSKENIGIGFQDRELKELVKGLEGIFADVLPAQAFISLSKTFGELIQEISKDLAAVRKHLTYPRDLTARYPIVSQNSAHIKPRSIPIVVFEMDSQEIHCSPESNHSLLLGIPPTSDTFTAYFRVDLIDEAQASSLVHQLQTLLEAALEDPDRPISELPILSNETLQMILNEWNNTEVDYAREKCLHQLFEEQAEKFPDNIAAISDDGRFSYSQLNQRANRTAEYLIKRGVGPETLVGICYDRSLEMLVGLLGILKAGGAYVPLEPSNPAGRIEAIVKKAKINIILTQEKHLHLVAFPGVNCISMDRVSDEISRESSDNPVVDSLGSSNTAYVIFTSGSTGEPKGVVVTHRPVINLIDWALRTFSFTEKDCVLFITALGFDLSVFDIFGILSCGGCIRIVGDEKRKDLDYIARLLCEEPITFWDSAPAALQLLVPFLETQRQKTENSALRLVFLSGDWIPLSLPDQIKSMFHNAEIISLGGATEATVWSNYYPITKVDPQWRSIPYGKPIQNAKYFILNEGMNPCSVGIAGDLYIGGECLSEGYINAPELTSQSFIPDPFSLQAGAKIYRTGDLARYFDDGNIEFLGRSDFQVKVRGYRIELGEIEQRLRAMDGISEAVVMVKEIHAMDQKLVAYVIPETGKNLSGKGVREELGRYLPNYMVPNYVAFIEKFPVTNNGKLDRKALPWPVPSSVLSAQQSSAEGKGIDQDKIRDMLNSLFSNVLDFDFLGNDDDLFDLGVSSLNMIQATQKIKESIGISIPVEAILEMPTLNGIIQYIQKADGLVTKDQIYRPETRKTASHGIHPAAPACPCKNNDVGKDAKNGDETSKPADHDFNKLERSITAFLCKMLNVEQLEPNTDLFDLGISSLNMIQLTEKIREIEGIVIPVEALLEKPTISGITEFLLQNHIKGKAVSIWTDTEPTSCQQTVFARPCNSKQTSSTPTSAEFVDLHQSGRNNREEVKPRGDAIALPNVSASNLLRANKPNLLFFDSGPVDLNAFGRFLSSLREENIEGAAKYLYPSAGGLYAVQTYINIKPETVEGVMAGTYYYSPIDHALYLIDDTTIIDESIHHPLHRSLYNQACFSVFLVARMDAIRPIYNTMGTTLVSLDAGYLCQLLINSETTSSIKLCPVEGVDFEAVRSAFKLEEDHLFMHCLLGGKSASDLQGYNPLEESRSVTTSINPFKTIQTGITDHFRIQPPPIHNQNPAELSKLGQFNALSDDEHALFHKKRLNIRRFSDTASSVSLPQKQFDKKRYLHRSSWRSYLQQPISLTAFSRMLSLFRPIDSETESGYLYPSSNGAYSIQTYLYIKPDAIEGLEEGIYSYHSGNHTLFKVCSKPSKDIKYSHYPGNRSFYDHCGFCIFHIARLDILQPVFGNHSIHHALRESGAMGQLLMDHQDEFGVGVCPIGGMNFERIASDFRLNENQVIVQSFLGGYVDHAAIDAKFTTTRNQNKLSTNLHFAGHRRRDIAIIGISGRFPGAETPETFWQNIKNGTRCYSTNYQGKHPGDGHCCGVLSSRDYFDSLLFNTSPSEARRMDPQERQCLEIAWECLENAGFGHSCTPSFPPRRLYEFFRKSQFRPLRFGARQYRNCNYRCKRSLPYGQESR